VKTLAEYNKATRGALNAPPDRDPAGVLCNICRREMEFTDNTVMLSNPPQRNVECPYCRIPARKYG